MKYSKAMKGRPIDSRLMKFVGNPIQEETKTNEISSIKSKVPMTPQILGSSNARDAS